MKIIFLDIDGVLNCEKAYVEGFCKRLDKYGQSFYPPSAELLNKLIDETEAKIVISSTWRHSGLETMQNMWKDRGMSGEVIGITTSLRLDKHSIPRGLEIEFYLDDMGFSHIFWCENTQSEYMKKSNIENYLIIDDDSDMLYNQKEHFVNVLPSPRNKEGFNEKYYQQSIDILSKDIIQIHFSK